MPYCHPCNEYFYTWYDIRKHWAQSPLHEYCKFCEKHVDDIVSHNMEHHAICEPCRKVFEDESGLHKHRQQSERHRDRYCPDCRRIFASPNNLKAHRNSSVHKPKSVRCPFGCGGTFVSNSALTLHLENGACRSGINRRIIDRIVRQYDTNNIITDPSRMIAGGSDTDEDITYATKRSWNEFGYECYLCHNVHRTLASLNQHLASPRHKDKIYICRGPECGVRFTALSGLVQHIESDKCGVARFKNVQNAMNSLLGQMGRLTM